MDKVDTKFFILSKNEKKTVSVNNQLPTHDRWYDKVNVIDRNAEKLLFNVEDNGYQGIIDIVGNNIIPLNFNRISVQVNGIILFNKKSDFFSPYDLITDYNLNILFNNHDNYESVFPDVENDCIICIKSGKYGILDFKQNVLTDFKYQYIHNFFDGLAFYKNLGAFGLMSNKGIEITKAIYSNLIRFNNNLFFAKYGNYWVVLNRNGDKLREFSNVEIFKLTKNLFCSIAKDKVQIFNSDLVELENVGFEYCKYLNEMVFAAKKDNLWGIINNSLLQLTPFNFDDIKQENNQFIAIKKGTNWALSDNLGYQITDFLFENYVDDKLLKNIGIGLEIYKSNDKYGLINSLGKILTKAEFEIPNKISPTHFGFIILSKKQAKYPWLNDSLASQISYGLLNSKGEEILPFEYSDIFFNKDCEELELYKNNVFLKSLSIKSLKSQFGTAFIIYDA